MAQPAQPDRAALPGARPNPHMAGGPSGSPLIQIRNLSKLYRMGDTVVRALDGVDLNVAAGEFVAITGASGSGKSTMMHLLGCLDRPTSGTYSLNNRSIGDLSDRELARLRNEEIGFVFQTFNLINRTSALDNVGVPLFYARKANARGPSLRALERVGLAHRAHHKPNELSGGERQRVAIARAIVNDPFFLLADEPTGNLDSKTGEQIMQVFHGLNEQGVTIVLVTHEPDVAIQARRIVQMRDGKIVSDRLTADILREQGAPQTSQLPQIHSMPADVAAPIKTMPGALDAEARPQARKIEPPQQERALEPRMARGATNTLVCGIIATTLAAGGHVGGWLMSKTMNIQKPLTPGQMPPPEVMAGGCSILAAFLVAIVLGLIAIFVGRGVFRRIHQEPGNWLGVGRARAGFWLGTAGLVLPFAVPLVSFVVRKLI